MKKLSALLLAIFMLLSLCACGNTAKTAASTDSYSYYSGSDAAYESVAGEANYGGFAVTEDAVTASGTDSGVPEDDPQKIIYSAEATVETTEFDDACAAVLEMVEQCGGWVESSSVNGSNYYSKSRGASSNRSASYQLRVPSEKFSTVMGQLSALGNVPYSYTYTDNVTAQYYDLNARLTAYETQEARLLEMMEKAETVSDIITIEDRLTELRYEIESIQSTLNSWDRQVSYSLVSLTVKEVQEYTPEATQSYWQELWQSLVDGLKDAVEFIKDAFVFLVGALPVLIVLALLVLLAIWIVKKLIRQRRTRREKKAAKAAEDEDSKK